MEFVWMIPLYIVIPITGFILLYNGFSADKRNGRKRIGLGFLLLSLPFIHGFLVQWGEAQNEKSLIGSYSTDSNKKVILKLHPDKTFELAKIDSIESFGNGKWQYIRWDIDEVQLIFSDSSMLSFNVVFEENGKFLQNSFWTGNNHKYVKLVSTAERK